MRVMGPRDTYPEPENAAGERPQLHRDSAYLGTR
jgi:hypothetical protein